MPTSPSHISVSFNDSSKAMPINSKTYSPNRPIPPKVYFSHRPNDQNEISALQSEKPTSAFTRINSDDPINQFVKNPDSVIQDLFGELGGEEPPKEKD